MAFGIWNNLDEAGLYLNIERLENETDEIFHSRLKKFGKWKFKTDYNTQVHSIPIQAGLDTKNLMEVTCSKRFKATLDWEYFIAESFNEDGTTSEYIRVFINTPDCTLRKITDILEASTDFTLLAYSETYKDYRLKGIVRGTNTFIHSEQIQAKYWNLSKKNIVDKTFRSDNSVVINREVSSLPELKSRGDYFLDKENGYIETYSPVAKNINVTYRYYNPRFIIEYTDINLIPLNILAKYGVTDDLVDMIPYILAKQAWGK